jgi:hypothetical protein
MTNLFPLPYWAPALTRVPIPLQALDAAFRQESHAPKRRLFEECCALGVRSWLQLRSARPRWRWLSYWRRKIRMPSKSKVTA